MRRAISRLALAALLVGPTLLAFLAGGYFDRPRIAAAAGVWALVVAAALWAPRPLPDSTPGRAALAGLVLLCLWTALSITWAPLAGRAVDDLQRLVLYLGFFVASMAFLRNAQARRWLEPAVVLGALAAVLYGLSERLLPGLIELTRSFASAGRLEQPLTYWNALGILAAVGFVLAARIAGDPERPAPFRAAAAAAAAPVGLGVYLTFARGALAAIAVGLAVLLALAPAGRDQLRSIIAVTVATAVAALTASSLPTIESLEEGQRGDAGDGLLMLAVMVLLSAGAALTVLWEPARRLPALSLPGSRPRAVLAASVIALVLGGLAVAAFEGKPEVTSPVRGANPGRLGSIDTNRYRYWEVAWRSFRDEPLTGLGSGAFQVEWLKERDRVDKSGDAHSLYLETAAELGVVGVAFLLLFLGGAAAAAARLYRIAPSKGAGLVAALAAWCCHAGLDWDWEMPAVTLPALLLAAAAIAWSEQGSREPADAGEPSGSHRAPDRLRPAAADRARVTG
jgi:hypothetical protein